MSHSGSDSILHKTFTRKYKEGFYSLGFTNSKNRMVYMKPHSDKRIKTSEEECYCFQVPDLPYTDEYLLSLKIDWHLIIEARVELEGK